MQARPLATVLMLVVSCLVAGLASVGHADPGYTSDQTTIQIVSTNVQGKNVYIPGTIVLVGGRPHTLSFFNTTEVPHGFRVEGLGVETVLPPRVEHPLSLPALEGGRIYQVNCQLHPAHRTGTLVVMHAADVAAPPAPPPTPGAPTIVD